MRSSSCSQVDTAYKVGGDVSALKAIFAPDPEYSEEARKQSTKELASMADGGVGWPSSRHSRRAYAGSWA
jgi:hypothetical protein